MHYFILIDSDYRITVFYQIGFPHKNWEKPKIQINC